MILVSASASYVGHGTFFLIALYRREGFLRVIQRFIKVDLLRLESLVARFGTAAIFITQWLYGFRLLSAAVLGLSRMGRRKYFTLQFISCIVWAIICTGVGYFFGATLKNLIGDIKRYNIYIAMGFVAAGFLIWFLRDVRKRR